MNLRLFSVVLLSSALPITVQAGGNRISLRKEDFHSARRVSQEGETVLNVKLSKSGKAKLRKLAANDQVEVDVGGVKSLFKVKVPIEGEGLEMGPYSTEKAAKVNSAIEEEG